MERDCIIIQNKKYCEVEPHETAPPLWAIGIVVAVVILLIFVTFKRV